MKTIAPDAASWNADLYEKQHRFVFDLARGLVDLLDPQPGEKILDVGCGTGQLTEGIHERMVKANEGANSGRMILGANARRIVGVHETMTEPPKPGNGYINSGSIIGIDPSETMIQNARENYPNISFKVMDVTAMNFESEFDAVFSNAVLHWVPDANLAARNIARALKPGGRFVAEFGGRGNVGGIVDAAVAAMKEEGIEDAHAVWFYPSIGEYAPILERHGLEVQQAMLFDRPTKLEGETGLRDWFRMFSSGLAGSGTAEQRNRAFDNAMERLRPTHFHDGAWWADYRRIRVLAVKKS